MFLMGVKENTPLGQNFTIVFIEVLQGIQR